MLGMRDVPGRNLHMSLPTPCVRVHAWPAKLSSCVACSCVACSIERWVSRHGKGRVVNHNSVSFINNELYLLMKIQFKI